LRGVGQAVASVPMPLGAVVVGVPIRIAVFAREVWVHYSGIAVAIADERRLCVPAVVASTVVAWHPSVDVIAVTSVEIERRTVEVRFAPNPVITLAVSKRPLLLLHAQLPIAVIAGDPHVFPFAVPIIEVELCAVEIESTPRTLVTLTIADVVGVPVARFPCAIKAVGDGAIATVALQAILFPQIRASVAVNIADVVTAGTPVDAFGWTGLGSVQVGYEAVSVVVIPRCAIEVQAMVVATIADPITKVLRFAFAVLVGTVPAPAFRCRPLGTSTLRSGCARSRDIVPAFVTTIADRSRAVKVSLIFAVLGPPHCFRILSCAAASVAVHARVRTVTAFEARTLVFHELVEPRHRSVGIGPIASVCSRHTRPELVRIP